MRLGIGDVGAGEGRDEGDEGRDESCPYKDQGREDRRVRTPGAEAVRLEKDAHKGLWATRAMEGKGIVRHGEPGVKPARLGTETPPGLG
jgi:hypothetical protein